MAVVFRDDELPPRDAEVVVHMGAGVVDFRDQAPRRREALWTTGGEEGDERPRAGIPESNVEGKSGA